MVHWTHIIPHLSVSPRPCFHALKQSLGCFFHLTAAGYPSEYSMWSHESPYCWWFRNPVNSPVEGTVVLSHYFPRFYICIQPVVFTPNFWTIQQWTPQSWKQKKSNHTRVSPNPAGRPPNFPPVFPVNLSPPPGQNKPPGGLAQISIKPCYLGGHLLSASPTGSYMTEKNLRNAFNWGLFFFAKKIMCFLYIQEHMFRKLWKCIEILIWQSVYKEKIYSLTRKRPIRDF